MEVALPVKGTTGDIINFERTVNKQIERIAQARSADAPAARELLVLDELLDAWRDGEYDATLQALANFQANGGGDLDYEGQVFRAIMGLAKRQNLLDTMEEAYL